MLKPSEEVKILETRAVDAVRDLLGDVPSVEVERTTVAVKSVLVEIGQVLGSHKGKFAVIGGAVPWLRQRFRTHLCHRQCEWHDLPPSQKPGAVGRALRT